MARYLLKNMSKSSYQITLNRQKVGSVLKRDDGWYATINGDKTGPHSTASDAFQEAVRIANRISICGENDAMKAYEVIQEKNRQVRREVEDFNRNCGLRVARVRTRKVAI